MKKNDVTDAAYSVWRRFGVNDQLMCSSTTTTIFPTIFPTTPPSPASLSFTQVWPLLAHVDHGGLVMVTFTH